jgi:hypothetical protein
MATENKDVKTITLTELQEHVVQEDIYALIHGKGLNTYVSQHVNLVIHHLFLRF